VADLRVTVQSTERTGVEMSGDFCWNSLSAIGREASPSGQMGEPVGTSLTNSS